MTAPQSFVCFKPKDNQVEVSWNFTTFFKPEKNGKATCYLYGFDIFFQVNKYDETAITTKSTAILKMFFDHLFLHSGKNGLKSCAMQLHKLGFKSNNDALTLKKLINNERISAKFNSVTTQLPADFVGSERVSKQEQMEIEA